MVCHKVVIGSFVRLRVLQARDTGAFVAESSSRAEPPAAAEGRSRGTRPLVLPLPGATSSARPCSYGGRRTVDGAGRGARAARSCRWRQARGTGRPLWRRPGGAGRLPERPGQGAAALRLPASGHVAVQGGTARAAPHAHPEFAAWGPSVAPHCHSHAARMSQRMTVCLSSAAVTEHHGRRGSSTAETHFSRLWQLVGWLVPTAPTGRRVRVCGETARPLLLYKLHQEPYLLSATGGRGRGSPEGGGVTRHGRGPHAAALPRLPQLRGLEKCAQFPAQPVSLQHFHI